MKRALVFCLVFGAAACGSSDKVAEAPPEQTKIPMPTATAPATVLPPEELTSEATATAASPRSSHIVVSKLERGPMPSNDATTPHVDPQRTVPDRPRPGQAETSSAPSMLSDEAISSTIDASRDALAKCTALDATVSAKMLIAPDGAVSDVAAPRSTPDDPRMRDCVIATLKQLTFGKTGGPSVPLHFELAIHP